MFYNRFEFLCSQRSVTMSKAATEAGINKSAVTYWKNHEEAKPTGQIAEKLCAYFGITMSELYGDTKKEALTPEGERPIVDDDIKFALFGTREIDDDVLDRVKQFAKFAQENEKNK